MTLHHKVGFLGVGNLAQAMIKGLVENKILSPSHIFGANRSPGKLQKAAELYGIQALANNEEVIDQCDVVILAMKPQDLSAAVDSIASSFTDRQIVISLAAGVSLHTLEKKLPQCRIIRLMPNTPTLISRGVLGYVVSDPEDTALPIVVEDLFAPLGYVLGVEDEDQFEALMIACSSGTGFVFELMTYWQDWIEERGFDPSVARKMTVETFMGAAMLAAQSKETPLEDLLNKVASKKGITAAGLQSMRELETERTLRISFEKAALRNQELAKEN
jgi:pyrroline-5-carboxylate reductase